MSSHVSAFAALLAGIRRREGLLALTGEVGTGKTTLCRAVLQSLDRNTVAAFVPDPFLSREDLLKILLVEFGVVSIDDVRSGRLRGASRTDLCYPLYEFLTSLQPLQSFAVMMIDEAQNLSSQLLEEIRILSDLENRQKLLHVVLVGQPELQMRLDAPEMRQLSQRLSVRCELLPLERRDIGPYISHRLAIAGNNGAVEFTQPTIEVVWRASRGIPRVINLVCDRALFSAASAGRKTVDLEDVQHYLERPGTLAGRERRHDQSRPDAQHTRSPLPMQPVLFGGLLGHAAPSTLPEAPAEVAYEEDAASTPQRRGRLLALVTTLVVATAVIGYWSWAPKASPPRLSELTQPSQSPSARPVPPKDSLGPSTGR